ncbi:DUF1189 family protein [Clostridium septicum]|uniref:DUF1189 domain-containing protein n=1 Tax=Clostridium septicum TaxID=1504 RepID=A0ABY5B172_CLOSE|nr:DUF1189 family protein [Clostridium septicum]UEC21007.1 DUF1189 domain-containing protein [Clostridium septicum]USS00944.1 DUF1189 domain-containing protein [Clostridium septicum]WLF69494.1 DUF1189 family protein [Clostridium septicum]
MKLSFIKRMRISVANIRGYDVLVKECFNKVLMYILVLSLIIGLTLGISQAIFLGTFENIAINLLNEEDYKFEMKNGELNFEKSPYEKEEGSVISIFDTTKSVDDVESYRSIVVHKDMSVIFFKDGVVARSNGDQYIAKFKDIPFMPEYMNNDTLIDAVNKLSILKYIIIVVMVLVKYAAILVQGLIVSVAGILINKMKKTNLKYVDILKISLYAMTLPIILSLIIPIGAFTVVIATIYVIMVIKSLNNKK